MEDAIDQVCKDLPEGWLITLGMERGAAWVNVNDPDGCDIKLDSTDESLIDQLISGLEFAKRKAEVD